MSPARKHRPLEPHRKPHATGRHGTTPTRAIRHLDTPPRPCAATIIALGASGWHVTELRPDVPAADEPVLWRVTIERYDESMSITVTEADPEVGLEELARYAAVDATSRAE